MVDFAKGLLLSLGYDEEEYDFDSMTYQQCGDLIDQLKKVRGYFGCRVAGRLCL